LTGPNAESKLPPPVRPVPAPTRGGGFRFPGMQTVDPRGDHLTIATSMSREMHLRFRLEQAEEDRNTEEAARLTHA